MSSDEHDPFVPTLPKAVVQIQIVTIAMSLNIIAFMVLALALRPKEYQPLDPSTARVAAVVMTIVAALELASARFVMMTMERSAARRIKLLEGESPDVIEQEFNGLYRMHGAVRSSIIGGAGVVCMVAYLVTGLSWTIGAAAFALAFLWSQWPTELRAEQWREALLERVRDGNY